MKEDQPMSDEPFSIYEVKNDLSSHLKGRNRTSMQGMPVRQDTDMQQARRGRSSLIPFSQHRASQLSNATSDAAKKRYELFSEFNSLNPSSKFLQNSNLNINYMFAFFQGKNNEMTKLQEPIVPVSGIPRDNELAQQKSSVLPIYQRPSENVQMREM